MHTLTLIGHTGRISKLLYNWARKGGDLNEPLQQFEVEQDDLNFWQALSRCVAYAAYSNL